MKLRVELHSVFWINGKSNNLQYFLQFEIKKKLKKKKIGKPSVLNFHISFKLANFVLVRKWD